MKEVDWIHDGSLRDTRPPQWAALILRMELIFVVDTARLLVSAPPVLNKQPVAGQPAGQPGVLGARNLKTGE